MKKMIYLLLITLLGVAVVSCQKEKIDPSSPVGRQWIVQDDENPDYYYLYDIGAEKFIELSGITAETLKAKKLYYNDVECDTVESVEQTTDSDGDPVWQINLKRYGWKTFKDVTRKSAKIAWGDDYIAAKPLFQKIQLEYRYSPTSAKDLGVSVYWGYFNMAFPLYCINVDNGHSTIANPNKDLVSVFNTYFENNKEPVNRSNNGAYYAWGETETKSSYTSSNYTYKDNPAELPYEKDPVYKKLGGGWRMPTKAEFEELLSRCPWSPDEYRWTDIYMYYYLVEGMQGYEWRNIFLPFAGYMYDSSKNLVAGEGFYWTSTPASEGKAWALHISKGQKELMEMDRYLGLSVRPVWDPTMK